MNLIFAPNNTLQIDNAKITYPNFRGLEKQMNRAGDRNFVLLIDNEEIADALINDTNKYGVGWNVKIKPPREEGDTPRIYLPVKVKFNAYGPNIYLESDKSTVKLDEESVGCLDKIKIASVDLDIRPYDGVINGKPYRSAYLKGMHVIQELDRFEKRYNDSFEEDEYDDEAPFDL